MTAEPSHPAAAVSPSPRPFYLEGPAGPLFCLELQPSSVGRPRGSLLYLPPFAEEANRARRMAVLQARRLAAQGWPVLLLDPFGTGDSGGSFEEARWDLWLDDALCATDWLTERYEAAPVVPWGLRLGALLAAALAAREPERFKRLLLWQPVLRGDQFISQFLRLRVAAAMAVGEKETGQDLRARLAAGEVLEVAGYELAPDLVADVDALRLDQLLAPLEGCAIDWLELSVIGNEPALAPASRRFLDALAEAGGPRPASQAVPGEPFWTIQEITLAPNLLEATDVRFA